MRLRRAGGAAAGGLRQHAIPWLVCFQSATYRVRCNALQTAAETELRPARGHAAYGQAFDRDDRQSELREIT